MASISSTPPRAPQSPPPPWPHPWPPPQGWGWRTSGTPPCRPWGSSPASPWVTWGQLSGPLTVTQAGRAVTGGAYTGTGGAGGYTEAGGGGAYPGASSVGASPMDGVRGGGLGPRECPLGAAGARAPRVRWTCYRPGVGSADPGRAGMISPGTAAAAHHTPCRQCKQCRQFRQYKQCRRCRRGAPWVYLRLLPGRPPAWGTRATRDTQGDSGQSGYSGHSHSPAGPGALSLLGPGPLWAPPQPPRKGTPRVHQGGSTRRTHSGTQSVAQSGGAPGRQGGARAHSVPQGMG